MLDPSWAKALHPQELPTSFCSKITQIFGGRQAVSPTRHFIYYRLANCHSTTPSIWQQGGYWNSTGRWKGSRWKRQSTKWPVGEPTGLFFLLLVRPFTQTRLQVLFSSFITIHKRAWTIKLFTVEFTNFPNKLQCLSLASLSSVV